MCNVLLLNCVLASLDLRDNRITKTGAMCLCSVLERNAGCGLTTLKYSNDRNGTDWNEIDRLNCLLRRNNTRLLRRVALLSLIDEDYNREKGVLDLTNVFDLVFQNEYMISRMYSYV